VSVYRKAILARNLALLAIGIVGAVFVLVILPVRSAEQARRQRYEATIASARATLARQAEARRTEHTRRCAITWKYARTTADSLAAELRCGEPQE
jgi:hypothetical protein